MSKTENPYVGPIPFGPEHQSIFFGRDAEANELLSLVIANRIVLLYAKSGAGKTSLLRARLILDLEKEQFEVLSVARVKGQVAESDPVENLYAFNIIQSLANDKLTSAQALQLNLRDYLRSLKRKSDQFGDALPRVLIIDQFEELFNLYPDRWMDREGLFRQLNNALESDPQLRIVLGMREDYIAHLDSYTKMLPDGGIRARFRLELLREQSALAAITEPAKYKGRNYQPGVANKLVEELRKERGETSTGQTQELRGEYIEPVQLQIVCSRLWKYLPVDSAEISDTDVQEYGDVDEALAEFYSDCLQKASLVSKMSERRLGIWVEKNLITPASTRGTVYGGHAFDDPALRNALIHLADLHLLRVEWRAGSQWYELSHDRFINPIKEVNNKTVDTTRSGRKIRRRVRLFLAYARSDEAIASRLYQSLVQDGFDVWWDREAMPARSLSFLQEIRDAIDSTDKLLLIISPQAVQSEYVSAEWEHALNICKPIIPILVSGNYKLLPQDLTAFYTPDFRSSEQYELSLEELIRIVEASEDAAGSLYGVPLLPISYVLRNEVFTGLSKRLLADVANPVVTSANPMITIQGMGGVGKSVLASALARDCSVRKAFPDGIVWLEIGRSPSFLARMADVGAIFGDDRDYYVDVQSAKARLERILASRTVLIILDDVWEADHVRYFQDIGTRCQILITTRNGKLSRVIQGIDIKLDTLAPDEGAQLIALRTGVDHPANRAISEFLGGHTLAIALAAAQIANGYADSPEDMLQLLKKRPDPFKDLALDNEDKDLNLSLSLSLSYDSLNEDHKRRFRITGIFAARGSFDREALATVWDEKDEDDARAPLRTLEDTGLLEATEQVGRFSQHPLLRAYSRALLSFIEELDPAFERWADYYIELASGFRNLPSEEWGRLEADLTQIFGVGDELVLRFAAEQIGENMLSRCGRFAWNIVPYLTYRREALFVSDDINRVPKRMGWLEMGLEVWRKQGVREREAVTLNHMGRIWSYLGEQRRALDYYERALVIFREADDQAGEINALNNIGVVWDSIGEKRKALDFYEQALPLRRTIGDRAGEAATLNNIGGVWSALGEVRKALDYYEQALPLRRAVGDRAGEAATLNNTGSAWSAVGEKRRAQDYYEQALSLYRAVGDRAGEAATLNNIGGAWSALGEVRKALDYYEQALPLRRAVGDRAGEAATLNNIGGAWSALEEVHKALDYYEQALPLYRMVEDRAGEAATLNNIGGAWSAVGEKRNALDYYEQALWLRRSVGDRAGEAITYYNIGMVYRELGDLDKAIHYVELCIEIEQHLGHPDLNEDRRILEQLKQERDEKTSTDRANEFMHQIIGLYAQGGTEVVREFLIGQVSDKLINQIISQLEASGGKLSFAQNTLRVETVQQLAHNTVAVMTNVADRRDEWQSELKRIREDFVSRGDNWNIEVVFVDALLSAISGNKPNLPENNPYSSVIKQVLALIEGKSVDASGIKIDYIVEQLKSTTGDND